MGLETAALVAAGGGSLLQGIGGLVEGGRRSRASRRLEGQLSNGPGLAEQQILEAILGTGARGGQAFNTGQDALMQMLRAEPDDSTAQAIIEALAPSDTRLREESVGTLRAGASGLGERFGSANRSAEVDLLSRISEQTGVRNAGLIHQVYQAALDRAARAGEALFAGGQNLLQLLTGAESSRRSIDAQIANALLGAPVSPSIFGVLGGSGMDIGQLLLLSQFMQRLGTGTGGSGG